MALASRRLNADTRFCAGVFSPSSPAIHDFPRRFARALAALEQAGMVGVVAQHASGKSGINSGSIAERVADIHALLRDDRVDVLLASAGGLTSNTLLAHIDWDLFREYPKPILGFSDVTALQLAAYARTSLVSYYGPALLPSFGDFPEPDPYMVAQLRLALSERAAPMALSAPDTWSDEFLFWDRDDDRPVTRSACLPWTTIHPGEAEGPLVGGNLDTLVALLGTPYLPSFDGCIFFWEEAFSSLGRIERSLTCLELAGVFHGIRGMVVGKPFHVTEASALSGLVETIAQRYDIPAIGEVNFGHTTPIMTLPIGAHARLSTLPAGLTLLELAPRQ